MSQTNQNPVNTARLNIVETDQQGFPNSLANDLVFYINSEQRMLIGPYNFNDPSILTLKRDSIEVNGSMDVFGDVNTYDIYSSNIYAHLLKNKIIETDTLHADESRFREIQTDNIYSLCNITDKSFAESSYHSNLDVYQQLKAKSASIENASFSNIQVQDLNAQNLTFTDVNVEKIKGSEFDVGFMKIKDQLISIGESYLSNLFVENSVFKGPIETRSFIQFGKSKEEQELDESEINLDCNNLFLFNEDAPEVYNIYWGENSSNGLLIRKEAEGHLSIQSGKFGSSSNILSLKRDGFLTTPEIDTRSLNVTETLTSQGPLSVKSSAHFKENVLIDKNVDVIGQVSCESLDVKNVSTDNLSVRGLSVFENKIQALDAATFYHDSSFHSNVLIKGTLSNESDVYVGKTLKSSYLINETDASIHGTLYVHEEAHVDGNIITTKDVHSENVFIHQHLMSKGDISTEKDINALGNVTVSQNIVCSGHIRSESNIEVKNVLSKGNIVGEGSLDTHGSIHTQSNLLVDGDLTVLGDINLEMNDFSSTDGFVYTKTTDSDNIESVLFIHDDGLFVGGKLHVNVDFPKHTVDIDGDFHVTRASFFDENLTVKGSGFIEEQLKVKKQLSVEGDSTFYGNIDVLGPLNVSDKLSVDDLEVKHRLKCDGTVTLSNDLILFGRLLSSNAIHCDNTITGHNVKADSHLSAKCLSVNDHTCLDGLVEIKNDKNTPMKIEGALQIKNGLEVREGVRIHKDLKTDLSIFSQKNVFAAENVDGSRVLARDALYSFKETYLYNNVVINGTQSNMLDLFVKENIVCKGNLDVDSNIICGHNIHAYGDITATGTIHANSDGFSSDRFVFYKENEGMIMSDGSKVGEAILFIHDDGVFVGGSIHVNIDFPKYTVDVDGDMHITGPILFDSNVHIKGELHIKEQVDVQGPLDVYSHSTFHEDVSFKKEIDVLGTINAFKNIICGKDLHVHNDLESENISVHNDLTVQNKMVTYGNAHFEKDIKVEKHIVSENLIRATDIDIAGTLRTLNDSFVLNNSECDMRKLNVGESAHFKGPVVMDDVLTVYSDIISLSDRTHKKNIVPLKNVLKQIQKINAYEFEMTHPSTRTRNRSQYGVMAQEIAELYPHLVLNNDNKLGVSYNGLVSILLQGIKELNEKFNRFKKLNKRSIKNNKKIRMIRKLNKKI